MRVGLVIERFSPDGGGLETWTWQLAQALEHRGHDVSVITFRGVHCPGRAGIRVTALPWDNDRMRRAATAERALAGMQLDVTHDLGVCTRASILHPQAGSRLANERRESLGKTRLHRLAGRLDPRRARWLRQLRQFETSRYPPPDGCLVIAVSRAVAADLASWHGVPAKRIRIVPNGIDTARFAPPMQAGREAVRESLGVAGKAMFLFSAHNPHLKGIGPLLRAFARARSHRPHMMLVAIGKRPDARILRSVRRLGLQSSVRFDGPVSDPLPHYHAADAFVLPTWHDACSLSVLEACACGVPVITTRTNGASELLSPGIEGHIIESAGDVDALTGALADLAAPATRARMSARARHTALSNDFARNVDGIERVYREIVERLRSRTPRDGSS
jgi:UDP-glucose:(heptosyl)LPS alpha-1,3-glucosyltransferase